MMLEQIYKGLLVALQWHHLLIAFFGAAGGILIGGLPGLTATMGIALLIPITFGMHPASGLIMLGAVYCGAIYGGSIAAILVRAPGTPAAAATVFDGYEMTKKGEAGRALGAAVLSSFVGGFISTTILIFVAQPLAMFSLRFGPPEFMWLGIFGLTIIASLSGKSLLKGLISGAIGLLIATMGMHPLTGYMRFTFGRVELYDGVPVIIALIGLFSVSQVLYLTERKGGEAAEIADKIGRVLPTWEDLKLCKWTLLRSGLIGTTIGAIPGAGADIASFVGYNEARRWSKHPEKFGTGYIEGVVGSEAANNGVTGGSLIPLLTLGIPGNAVTAVLLGGLLIQGLLPGPELFTKHADITYGFIMSLYLAKTFYLILGFFGARHFVRVVKTPSGVLAPVITALAVIGSYAINNSLSDVWLMLGMGLLGYALRKFDFPLAPICLAIILGPMVESNLARTLTLATARDIPTFLLFFTRPICLILMGLIVLSLLAPYLASRAARKNAVLAQRQAEPQDELD
jgi:putative tricarboxylic transport membrane protein